MNGTDGARLSGDSSRIFPTGIFIPPIQQRKQFAAHSETTAPEVWRQTNGSITHFLAGLGTTEHFIGTSRGLKEIRPKNPDDFDAARHASVRSRRNEASRNSNGAGSTTRRSPTKISGSRNRRRASDDAKISA